MLAKPDSILQHPNGFLSLGYEAHFHENLLSVCAFRKKDQRSISKRFAASKKSIIDSDRAKKTLELYIPTGMSNNTQWYVQHAKGTFYVKIGF